MIGNSEVGMGSVSVEPFVFRKPCTNDLIVSQEKSFRHAHIHLTAYEMTRRMAEAVSEGFRVSSSLLDTFLKTREVNRWLTRWRVIRKIAEERKFSQKLTDEVVSSYLIEPEAKSVRRDQRFHECRAEARAASENRDGTVCRDVARSSFTIVLSSNLKPSKKQLGFFIFIMR